MTTDAQTDYPQYVIEPLGSCEWPEFSWSNGKQIAGPCKRASSMRVSVVYNGRTESYLLCDSHFATVNNSEKNAQDNGVFRLRKGRNMLAVQVLAQEDK